MIPTSIEELTALLELLQRFNVHSYHNQSFSIRLGTPVTAVTQQEVAAVRAPRTPEQSEKELAISRMLDRVDPMYRQAFEVK